MRVGEVGKNKIISAIPQDNFLIEIVTSSGMYNGRDITGMHFFVGFHQPFYQGLNIFGFRCDIMNDLLLKGNCLAYIILNGAELCIGKARIDNYVLQLKKP